MVCFTVLIQTEFMITPIPAKRSINLFRLTCTLSFLVGLPSRVCEVHFSDSLGLLLTLSDSSSACPSLVMSST